MEDQSISETKLAEMIEEKRGLIYGQSYISTIRNGHAGHLPAIALTAICEALNADINQVFWEELNPEILVNQTQNSKEQTNNIIYHSKKGEFSNYLGRYYCYFYPTISDETNKGLIKATLDFSLHENTKECIAHFCINTSPTNKTFHEKPDTKEYKGRLLLSSTYQSCYCYLLNEEFGEISFLIFDDINSNQNDIMCRMAMVLTPCAGGTRDSTCHRMFLSRKELSLEGIQIIKPHLKMNTAEIMITEEQLKKFFNENEIPEKFRDTILSLTEPEKFYRIREEHFWGFTERNMINYNKVDFITKLREYAHANNYQKIGAKVDKLLFQALYKSQDHDKYLKNETANDRTMQ